MSKPESAKPPSPPKKTTLHDVAEHVGVSYQTVSRVVNDHPNVASATRAKVARAIDELGYVPNRAAKSLVTRRSHTVGIVSYGSTYYGPSQMVAKVEGALRAKGYDLLLATVEDLSLEALRRNLARLQARRVDGMVLVAPIKGAHLEAVERVADLPHVVVDVPLGSPLPSVVIDQRYGSRLATEHLIELGHEAICTVRGPLGWSGADFRHEGWTNALERAELPLGPSVEGDWSARSGHAATRRLLAENARFTALVAGNDQMALGAIAALREAGRSVPGDVSVVGFDDIPEAAYFAPPLTTVRQDFTELGNRAAAFLVERMTGESGGGGASARQRVLYPELVVRSSTAPPA